MTATLRRVVFLKRVVCDYQVPFFLRLAERLQTYGASLTVLAGRPAPGEGLADGLDALPFGVRLATRRLPGGLWFFTGARVPLRGADLILLEQASAQLANYPLLLRRLFRRPPPVALVGHGAHFNRAGADPLRDAWRRFWLRCADRFFAYTDRSAQLAQAAGFPPDRITVFNNAVDTDSLARAVEAVTPADADALRRALFGPGAAGPIVLFCGRLVAEKEIPFLLETLDRLRARNPACLALLIGDGPEAPRVRAFCDAHPWCAWVGRRAGTERAPFFRLARLMLHPAPAGLAILDAFAAGLPFVTVDTPRHGPEIAYLKPGVNGLLTPRAPDAVAAAAADLLADPARLAILSEAARAEARLRTTERMADLFAAGIAASLAEGGRPA